jgi:hypothetical protein
MGPSAAAAKSKSMAKNNKTQFPWLSAPVLQYRCKVFLDSRSAAI